MLQLLKGRPPPHFFLHVYHHAVVLYMSWLWLETVQTLQFGGLLFNTSVHVVMYYYFFLIVLGKRPWWKRYVTTFQIVQFGSSAMMYLVTLSLLLGGAPCAGFYVRRLAPPLASAATLRDRRASARAQPLHFNLVFNMTLMYGFVGVLGGGKKSERVKRA